MLTEKKNADGTAFKKMSVEHGDLKKIKNYSGFQNSYSTNLQYEFVQYVRGCTDPMGPLRNPEFVRRPCGIPLHNKLTNTFIS